MPDILAEWVFSGNNCIKKKKNSVTGKIHKNILILMFDHPVGFTANTACSSCECSIQPVLPDALQQPGNGTNLLAVRALCEGEARHSSSRLEKSTSDTHSDGQQRQVRHRFVAYFSFT